MLVLNDFVHILNYVASVFCWYFNTNMMLLDLEYEIVGIVY